MKDLEKKRSEKSPNSVYQRQVEEAPAEFGDYLFSTAEKEVYMLEFQN